MSRLVYEGSVKNLWDAGDGRLEFEYTDAYSVFDWGRMPDQLARKGESLAAMGAYFFTQAARPETWRALRGHRAIGVLRNRFGAALDRELEQLEREGLPHHFLKRSHPNRLLVQRVEAVGPEARTIGGQLLNRYSNRGWQLKSRLIALEVVFRFGIPKGSSLLERLTPEYARQLGFANVPREGDKFDAPIIEFFTKLEDTDRFLTWEQALNYSGLEFDFFESLALRSMCLSVWLSWEFQSKGLELWDGKFEWALLDGKLSLVDSIGPDELRLIDPASGTQISKEFLRLFYRKTEWFEALNKAKRDAARDPKLDFKEETLKAFGPPPKLNAAFKEAADALYPSLAAAMTGENPGGLGLPLKTILEKIKQCQAV